MIRIAFNPILTGQIFGHEAGDVLFIFLRQRRLQKRTRKRGKRSIELLLPALPFTHRSCLIQPFGGIFHRDDERSVDRRIIPARHRHAVAGRLLFLFNILSDGLSVLVDSFRIDHIQLLLHGIKRQFCFAPGTADHQQNRQKQRRFSD